MRPLLRYGAVGALATALHYLLLVLCVELRSWPAWAASGFGAVMGAQLAYLGNRAFTFAHRGAMRRSWPRFQATAMLGAVSSMTVVGLGVHFGLHYLYAQGIATGLGMLLTFSINRRWTFR